MRAARRVRGTAGILLGVLLFAQAALAVAACDWLRVAPAQAISAQVGEPSCHDTPARNANLCLAHCLGGDQSADTPQVAIPASSQLVVLVIARTGGAPVLEAFQQFALHRPGAPPPRILYHSFLI